MREHHGNEAMVVETLVEASFALCWDALNLWPVFLFSSEVLLCMTPLKEKALFLELKPQQYQEMHRSSTPPLMLLSVSCYSIPSHTSEIFSLSRYGRRLLPYMTSCSTTEPQQLQHRRQIANRIPTATNVRCGMCKNHLGQLLLELYNRKPYNRLFPQ